MGNWQLEVFKMAVYMAFPVGSFYVYHQVDWFEEQLRDFQRKLRSRDSIENRKEITEFIDTLRSHRESKFQEELEKLKGKE